MWARRLGEECVTELSTEARRESVTKDDTHYSNNIARVGLDIPSRAGYAWIINDGRESKTMANDETGFAWSYGNPAYSVAE